MNKAHFFKALTIRPKMIKFKAYKLEWIKILGLSNLRDLLNCGEKDNQQCAYLGPLQKSKIDSNRRLNNVSSWESNNSRLLFYMMTITSYIWER